jgi:hypothetical protein
MLMRYCGTEALGVVSRFLSVHCRHLPYVTLWRSSRYEAGREVRQGWQQRNMDCADAQWPQQIVFPLDHCKSVELH